MMMMTLSIFSLFSAFGTLILVRSINEAKPQQQSREDSFCGPIEAAASGTGRILLPKQSPALLGACVFQGEI
jgi:hypothetical protein